MTTLLSPDNERLPEVSRSVPTAVARPPTGTLIVVLGIHRGGTSVINHAMETMGANLGNRLGGPKAGENDKGFFEDLDIVEINENILAAAGATWHTPAPVELSGIDPAQLAALQAKAVAVLGEKCRDRMFALKDPRLSRLLPFWQPVFDLIRVRVVYVIAVRNPVSVGLSLRKRNGFVPDKSYSLWLAHMVPALQATHDKLRAVVEYDSLLNAPRDELTRVAGDLGFVLDDERARTFETAFLDKKLQHWRFDVQDLEDMRVVPREVRELFTALVSVSRTDGLRWLSVLETAVHNAQRYLDERVGTPPRPGFGGKVASILKQIAAPFRAMRST